MVVCAQSRGGIELQILIQALGFADDSSTMKTLALLRCLLAATVWLAGMGAAQAEWAELMKDEDIGYMWDKESMRVQSVSRYVWTMSNLGKPAKAPNGEDYQSSMARWRIQCKSDSFVKLSESFYAKPEGKGREVAFYETADWRPRDAAIRPGSYLSLLKKQICAPSEP
jgi:hypothetical protein